MTNEELIEALAAYDEPFVYHIMLTRLVDDKSTYTLNILGEPTRDFSSHGDACDFVEARRRRANVTAILTRLRDLGPSEEMHNGARDWSDAKYGKPIGKDASQGCFTAMLTSLLGDPK